MTWLNGIPRRIRKLKPVVSDSKARGTSILDDRILQFFGAQLADGTWQTTVYIADIALRDDNETLSFVKRAVIETDLAWIKLLPSTDGGFVSAEWNQASSLVTFRVHSQNGNTLKQTSFSSACVYGDLVADGDIIALCTSSGTHPADINKLNFYARLEANARNTVNRTSSSKAASILVPDQIAIWNHSQQRLHTVHNVHISQYEDNPTLHAANFAFITPDRIALAGAIESIDHGKDMALLKCFSTQSSADAHGRTFARYSTSESGSIVQEIGISGSSKRSDIFLHVHDAVSIFHRGVLTGQVPSLPDPRMLGFVRATSHPSHHRSIAGSVHKLAAYSSNRVLIVRRRDPEIEDDGEYGVALILDFDHQRVKDIVDLDSSARAELKGQLSGESAIVRVITRRFSINSGGEEDDGEYPGGNPEWQAHLTKIYRDAVERYEEEEDPPCLEFQEPFDDHRNEDLFGFIESRVQLPEDLDPTRLAITSSALIYVPGAGKDWLILDFV